MSSKRYPRRVRYADEWDRLFTDTGTTKGGETESADSGNRKKSRRRQRQIRNKQTSYTEFDDYDEHFAR